MSDNPSQDIITTAVLTGLAALTVYASMGEILSLVRQREAERRNNFVLAVVATAGFLLLAYRWTVLHQPMWPPATHVDGLVLICIAVSVVLALLQHPKRVPGLAPFALPALALLLLWAICAGRWTYTRFNVQSLVIGVHLTAVYVATVFFFVAAAGGSGFLHQRSRIRRRQVPTAPGNSASLEALERLLVRSSSLGFALLTIALAAGIVAWKSVDVDTATQAKLGWKVGLATIAWGLYGIIMSVRVVSAFRGAWAAWMSILGVALLLATFAVAARSGWQNTPDTEGQSVPGKDAQVQQGEGTP